MIHTSVYRKGHEIILGVFAFSQIRLEIICCALIGLLLLQYIRKTNCDLRAGGMHYTTAVCYVVQSMYIGARYAH